MIEWLFYENLKFSYYDRHKEPQDHMNFIQNNIFCIVILNESNKKLDRLVRLWDHFGKLQRFLRKHTHQ